MPPAGQAKAEAGAEAAGDQEKPNPGSKLSVGLIIGFAVIMTVEGVLFFFLGKMMSGGPEPNLGLKDNYEQVDLGQVSKEYPASDKGSKEKLVLDISLVLNENFRDLAEVKKIVEKKKGYLKHIVRVMIIDPKNIEYVRKRNFLDAVAKDIKYRLNQELGVAEDGLEVIKKVIFPGVVIVPLALR